MKKLTTSTQVLIAVVLAVIAGLIFGEKMTVLQPIGDMFLSLIKTLVIPLVFCSICGAVSGMKDMTKLRNIGGKVLILFIVTTSAAEPFKKGIDSLTSVLYSLTGIIMKFSPIGIFCLLGAAIGAHGAEVFSAIGLYILEYIFLVLLYLFLMLSW